MSVPIVLTVDGNRREIDADPGMSLLYALRDQLGLDNPRFGCGLGQCGACTVHIEGAPVRSCSIPVGEVSGAVTTLAGLGSPDHMHKLQQAFVTEQATQCGYCLNGWIMTAAAILQEKPDASELDITTGLAGLKCRCGAHMSILRAVLRAARA
jgi:aerobic-type carbon monoxide dehydrogenase small subunit (CoxS/CutS family)